MLYVLCGNMWYAAQWSVVPDTTSEGEVDTLSWIPVNPEMVDIHRYPLAEHVPFISVTLEPGEVLVRVLEVCSRAGLGWLVVACRS